MFPGLGFDRVFQTSDLAGDRAVGVLGAEELGEAWAQEPVVDSGEEDRESEPAVADGVAVGSWDALDETVQAESS